MHWLPFFVLILARAASAEDENDEYDLTSRIVPTPHYLTPGETGELEVKVLEGETYLDLSSAEVIWENPAKKLFFGEQDGPFVKVTPLDYNGTQLDITLVTALVTVEEETYNVSRYVKILRPWGKMITRDFSQPQAAPYIEGIGTDRPHSCPHWPADINWVRERWYIEGKGWVIPAVDERFWYGGWGGLGLETVNFKSRSDVPGYSFMFRVSPYNRATANLYDQFIIEMDDITCITPAKCVQEYSRPSWDRCVITKYTVPLRTFFWNTQIFSYDPEAEGEPTMYWDSYIPFYERSITVRWTLQASGKAPMKAHGNHSCRGDPQE